VKKDITKRWLLMNNNSRTKLALIINQLDKIRKYYGQISPMIIYEKERIIVSDTELQKELEEGSVETNDVCNNFYDDDWYLSELVEKTFCNTVIISIYTLIEKYLNELCGILMEEKNIPINYEELTGQGVVRAKKYVEKLGGMSFCTKDSSFLMGINAIRNVLAHDNGDLRNCKKEKLGRIINTSQQAPGCKIIEKEIYDSANNKYEKKPQRIELDLEFVEYCFKQGQSVFDNLIKQLN
jgi:hypothetical protein